MPREDAQNQLQAIAHRVGKIRPEGNAEIALANLMTGALYALYEAAKLNYDDKRANPNPEVSKQEFQQSAVNISKGTLTHDEWLAGFYLNSALLRMAPLNERINRHTQTEHDIPELRRLVNKIKHEPDAQMGQAWHLTLINVVDALEELCERLENAVDRK